MSDTHTVIIVLAIILASVVMLFKASACNERDDVTKRAYLTGLHERCVSVYDECVTQEQLNAEQCKQLFDTCIAGCR